MKFIILFQVLLAVSHCAYVENKFNLGSDVQGQVLLWVEHKFTPIYRELQDELTLSLIFNQQQSNEISRITVVKYFFSAVS